MIIKLRLFSFVAWLPLAALLGSCVSSTQLEQMSVQEFAKMRSELPVSDNAGDRAYVQCVADALIAELDEPHASLAWDLELFDDDDMINAFAMPGGKIGVFSGLFKTATNQDQLAAVIGHEIAHVTRGHSLKRANSQQAATIGILAGAVASEAVRDNAGLIIMGAQLGLLLPYGRSQESESDIVGLEYMARAGFKPQASVQLWQNMAAEGGSGLPQFLSSHPSSNTRIRDLNAQIPSVMPLYNEAVAAGLRPDCRR